MPADSDPSLPQTFRPLGVRVVVSVLGGLLVVIVAVIWLSFPAEVRGQFTLLEKITVVAFGVGFYLAGFALARSRVVASADGLLVVNGFRSHRYEWNQVLAVTLRSGSPWAVLDLSDGTTIPAMGIQGSDGPRAVRQVRQVRALVERLTR